MEYNIKSAYSSNLSIDVPKSSPTSGTTLIYYRSTSNDNQKFIINKVDNNKNLVVSAENGNVIMTSKASNVANTQIMLIPQE